MQFETGNAICYSGYREGQSPVTGRFPSYAQVSEDLSILAANWKYLRLYDCSRHAEIVLEVIRKEGLDFQVMLGAEMRAEMSNPNCPWGADYDEATLGANRRANSAEIDRMIALANRYAECVFSVSVGNEASVEWTDHLVPVDKLIEYVRQTKKAIQQPVTFCENYVPWGYKLGALVAELDFISVHTYPVWEYLTVDAALEYTRDNYYSVARHYPDKAGRHYRSGLDHCVQWAGNRTLECVAGITVNLLSAVDRVGAGSRGSDFCLRGVRRAMERIT